MKDLAYFIGSVLRDDDCERLEAEVLAAYFAFLKPAVATRHPHIDIDALETDWRRLYPVAWTDFHRFLKGWSPEHWKLSSYSERVARDVVTRIQAGQLTPASSAHEGVS